MIPRNADERARWAVSGVFFVDGAALGGYAAQLPSIKEHLSLQNDVLGAALLAAGIGAVVTMPFAGFLIHRFGSRTVSIVAGLLLSATVPFLMVAPTLWAFVAVLALVGVFNGNMDVSMNAHSVAVQKDYGRPILSSFHGWFSLGGAIGGGSAALGARLGLTPTFTLVGLSLFLAIVLLASWPNLLPADVDRNAEGGPHFAIPRGALLPIGILVLFAFVTEGASWDWAAIYMRTELRVSRDLAAWGFGGFSTGMAVGRFTGDRLVHRLGPARVLTLGGVLAATGLLLAANVPFPYVAILGFVMVGVGLANPVPILFNAAGTMPGVATGVGIAAVTTCGYSGFLFGPPLIGHASRSLSLGFAMSCMALLCVVVAFVGPRFVGPKASGPRGSGLAGR